MAKNIPDLNNIIPVKFQLQLQLLQSGLKGGVMQVVDDGPEFWTASFKTQSHLSDADYGAWNAWLDSLRGGIFSLNAWVRKYPIKYKNGNYPGAFAGICKVNGFADDEVFLKDLPAGFEIVSGDVFTIPGDVDRLYRVIDGAIADQSGEINFNVQPGIHPTTQIDDDVYFTKPWFTAQIQPNVERGSSLLGNRVIKFDVVQRLKS